MIGGGILTWKLMPSIQSATATAPAAPTSAAAPAPTAAQPPPSAAPVAAGVPPLYLAQAQEVRATYELTKQGYGINGQFYPLSINLTTSIQSEPFAIDYLLNRQYRTLSTVFGVADQYSELGSSDPVPATCTLQVLLDDRPIVPLKTATRDKPLTLTNIDVTGGTRLRFVVTQNGSSGGGTYPCTLGNPLVAG